MTIKNAPGQSVSRGWGSVLAFGLHAVEVFWRGAEDGVAYEVVLGRAVSASEVKGHGSYDEFLVTDAGPPSLLRESQDGWQRRVLCVNFFRSIFGHG